VYVPESQLVAFAASQNFIRIDPSGGKELVERLKLRYRKLLLTECTREALNHGSK
jgi:hypothetical protein